jgi:hypothetical protein
MLPDNVDFEPLISKLEEKTKAGKVPWQPTAVDSVFVAAVGDSTFRIRLKDMSSEWEREPNIVPFLDLFDTEGKIIWSVAGGEVPIDLRLRMNRLHELAQRVANRVDERVHGMIAALDDLD